MGKDSFYYWMGVVEDRRDPNKLGRLRVRVLGTHTEDKQLIPTCELHWAYVYQPITWNQAMNGLGHSPTGPAEGTWVWGFFRDNDSAQEPVVLGTIHGIPEETPQPSIGFYDPSEPHHDLLNAPRKIRSRYYPNDGTGAANKNETTASLYPRATHPWGCVIGESDVNRLARAENITDTIIGVRKRQRAVNIPIAFSHTSPGRQFNEPLPSYNAEYPYNHVYESESGHILEVDDTPDNERIHIYHRSGTYIELGTGQEENPGLHGDFSMKIVGKTFEIHMENTYVEHQNALNVTVRGEVNFYCKDTINVQADGDMNVHVQGNYTEKVKGNYYTDISGSRVVRIGGDDELDVTGNQTMKVSGNVEHSSGGHYNVAAGGTITESAGGHFSMTSGSEISGDASVIHWNSGHSSRISPSSPTSPSVPAFPAPTGLKETRFESGSDPVSECVSDTSPILNEDTICGSIPKLPDSTPCP